MQENVKKCVSMAMKKFNTSEQHLDADRYGSTVYCPFDPHLNIGGAKIRFIVDVAADPNSFAFDHFKELGRWISVDLKETKVKSLVRKRVVDDMMRVDGSGVNGFCKLFIYEFFVVRRLSWQFLVHDLCLTFAVELDKVSIPFLKRWTGLYRGADIGCLFRLQGLRLAVNQLYFSL
jgi:hypothetical protein